MWRQLQFVGYHDCGVIREPYAPPCPEHHQVRIRFPGTASAAEIMFECPVCAKRLRKGFGMPPCDCGKGKVVYTVHRAASVYTPRVTVIVNSPDQALLADIRAAGGGPRALEWVLGGCIGDLRAAGAPSADSLVAQLRAAGLTEAVVAAMVGKAADMGALLPVSGVVTKGIAPEVREAAEQEALSIAVACASGRIQRHDLMAQAPSGSNMSTLYQDGYDSAFVSAGLEDVELIERFPVLTTAFGYTRGGKPDESTLKTFRSSRGDYVSYGEVAQTEAFFFRLRPHSVVAWLKARGWPLEQVSSDEEARRMVVAEARIPQPFDPVMSSMGTDVLRLVHSYAHRVIRLAAVHAGIEATALAEYLLPHHLGFFVYASARGDFVLGGLQAVFERSLHLLLRDVANGESQCALDPGCLKTGGACMACLHVGEPSCRYFNRFLGREWLFGDCGYLDAVQA